MTQQRNPFVAYEMSGGADMPLATAPAQREWMDLAAERWPYRCLPMTIANQAGWVVLCPVEFSAQWYGGPTKEAVQVTFADESHACIRSHFGVGTITFDIPYLFRTPPGVNLWVKGPANWIKDGIQALEGVVETDWLPFTFSMNWKITRPHFRVHFHRGEPICMLVPVPRELSQSLEPVQTPMKEHPEVSQSFEQWQRERHEFINAIQNGATQQKRQGWQRDYMKGLYLDGHRAPEHQTKLNLKEFRPAVPVEA